VRGVDKRPVFVCVKPALEDGRSMVSARP